MFLFITECIKYNYNNGKNKPVDITIDDNNFTYSNGFKRTTIQLKNIIGLSYGPRTTTFNNVNKCKPWLICSFILRNRTYDFEFKRFMDIMSLQYILKKYNPLCHIEKKETISYYFKKMIHRDKDNNTNNYCQWFKTIKYSNVTPYNHECPICLDNIPVDNQHILRCKHNYHPECIELVNNHLCPMCRKPF